MAQTGSASFPSVLHNITPERVVFVYNNAVSGSLDVALAYQASRELPDENLISISVTPTAQGVTATTPETPLGYTEYLTQIETPIKESLSNLGSEFSSAGLGGGSIWVIILGYGIPLMFQDINGEVIAVAGALQRLGQAEAMEDRKHPNHTYDRRGEFKFFDEEDASEVFITAIIDGPTSAAAIGLINRAADVDVQTFVAGEIFVDPFGLKLRPDELQYQADIIDFLDNEAPNLGMPINTTIDINDPYQEPTIASFFRDSFYWGWFNPTFSKSLFFRQNQRRVFLYNADDRAAGNIHWKDPDTDEVFDPNGSDLWCNLAINIDSGYASCAGSVSDPGEDAFLRPRPFFETLHRGATLGEAFLFASKFTNWKTILIGDPLTVVNFPSELPSSQDSNNTLVSNRQAIFQIKEAFEESLGWGARQTRITNEMVDRVVESTNLSEALALLGPISNWRDLKNQTAQNDILFSGLTGWLSYILKTTRLRLSEWLAQNGYLLTTLLNEALAGVASDNISTSFEYTEGEWEHIFVYTHVLLTFEDVHFDLQVSSESDFSDIVVDLSTSDDITGWKYESEPFIFVQLPDDGFPSNFSGRKMRFVSPAKNRLRRTEVYHIRWRALNAAGDRVFPINEEYFVESDPLIVVR